MVKVPHSILRTKSGREYKKFDSINFEDQNVVEEAENSQVLQVFEFQQQLDHFFEEKRGIILAPTEKNVQTARFEFDEQLLENQKCNPNHRIEIKDFQIQDTNDSQLSKHLLEIFNWYARKFLNVKN